MHGIGRNTLVRARFVQSSGNCREQPVMKHRTDEYWGIMLGLSGDAITRTSAPKRNAMSPSGARARAYGAVPR